MFFARHGADVIRTDAVIIGAGPAGLAAGACLQRAGVACVLLEQEGRLAAAWHRHYDRLHLHTDRNRSELPFFGYPRGVPRYPSRAQVIEYLEAYAAHFGLQPRFAQHVISARYQDGLWHSSTEREAYASRYLVVATGYNGEPYIPTWPGQETFDGEVVHSSRYTNGEPYRGRDVLVVGFGNSGGEIAIDLWEHGARPTLIARGPANVIPRDLLGIPILAIAIPLSRLPPRMADALTAPILRLVFGDITRLGLRRPPCGPFTQIRRKARIPLIDVGTIDLIRRGHIAVERGIARFTATGVVFAERTGERRFDAVILATGYRPALAFIDGASAVTDAVGHPLSSGRKTALPGLYLCGFYVSPAGMLREIAIEARQIARDIAEDIARHSDLSRGRAPRHGGSEVHPG